MTVEKEINITAMVRGNERYVVLFDNAHTSDALRTLGRWAANPELSFTWYDAANMSQKMRADLQAETIRR